MHDCIRLRHCLTGTVALRDIEVLRNLLRAGRGWKRRRSSGLFAVNFHLVSPRLGFALAFVMVGSGLGAMILPVVAQSIISRSGWRAAYAALGCIALLLGLPLSWKYIRERGLFGPGE